MLRPHRRQAAYSVLGLLLVFGALVATPARATANLYATNTSGSGTTTGTGTNTTTWGFWSVPEGSSSEAFSDQAVWILDPNDVHTGSIETGFFTGWGPTYGWTNQMDPYYTFNDGNDELDAPSSYDLPENTIIWMANHVAYNGTHVAIQVNNWKPTSNMQSYTFSPREPYTQGEVTNSDDTMGGGWPGGEISTMYYQAASNGDWYQWGIYGCTHDAGYDSTCDLNGDSAGWQDGGPT